MIEDTSGDTFSINQIGSNVTVTRTDAPWPWGMNLKFKCCKGEFILIFVTIHDSYDIWRLTYDYKSIFSTSS